MKNNYIFVYLLLICISLIGISNVYASELKTPEIVSFSKSTVEDNSLTVVYKTNNTGSNYSIELINSTLKQTKNLSGSVTSYTFQNLDSGKEYKVQIRACTNSNSKYSCSKWSKVFSATAGSSTDGVDISLTYTKAEYNGRTREPRVVVTDKNKILVIGTDYDVVHPSDHSGRIGKYNITVKGKGKYNFNKTLTYEIVLGTPQISRVMPTEDRIDVENTAVVNQVETGSGYQIAYKKSSAKKYTVFTSKGQIPKGFPKNKLKSSTKYNFKVRAFNKIDGKNVYSSWSKTITAKTLKKNNKYNKTVLSVFIKNYNNEYTGKNVKPEVFVTNYNTKKRLKKNIDYTVTYPTICKKTGYYSITVKGKGKYAKNYPQYIKYRVYK